MINSGSGVFSIEGRAMQIGDKFHVAHFMRLFYEGAILFFCVLSLVMAVALGAYALELIFPPH